MEHLKRHNTERRDYEQAERIDESLLLQVSLGTSAAACYLQYHRVRASTARRILLTQPHDRRRVRASPDDVAG